MDAAEPAVQAIQGAGAYPWVIANLMFIIAVAAIAAWWEQRNKRLNEKIASLNSRIDLVEDSFDEKAEVLIGHVKATCDDKTEELKQIDKRLATFSETFDDHTRDDLSNFSGVDTKLQLLALKQAEIESDMSEQKQELKAIRVEVKKLGEGMVSIDGKLKIISESMHVLLEKVTSERS